MGDRTRKGGKDEAGEPSGVHITKGPVSRCKKSLCYLEGDVNLSRDYNKGNDVTEPQCEEWLQD